PRLWGGHSGQGRHRFRPAAMAAGARSFGTVRASGRCALPAHARRLFHHDHARFCANGLLRRDRARPVRRRRRHDHLQTQPVRRTNRSLEQMAFYYLCLALLLATIYIVWRLVHSRFGMVIQGARSNDRRMRAIGFPTYRYKLLRFVFAGMLCGLAGALLANHTDFISPALMQWTRSGDLIVMAVLGGMGTVFGPVIGAVALLVLEELLSGITEYWQIILGPLFLLVVLFARGGIDGLLAGVRRG